MAYSWQQAQILVPDLQVDKVTNCGASSEIFPQSELSGAGESQNH